MIIQQAMMASYLVKKVYTVISIKYLSEKYNP
uniref:Uncharacterized protein n=1 Tax=Siphoviridae sp. ctm7X10 TaxID=2827929 RepID=A0A8S5S5A7_9CAUD|nr:MAG TPA: hypothetical protein [Siphoviridae sp. ctm7X10]